MSEGKGGRTVGSSELRRAIVGVTLLLKGDTLTDLFDGAAEPEKPAAGREKKAERAPEPGYGGTQRVVLPEPQSPPAVSKAIAGPAKHPAIRTADAAAPYPAVRARTKSRPARASPAPSVIPTPVFGPPRETGPPAVVAAAKPNPGPTEEIERPKRLLEPVETPAPLVAPEPAQAATVAVDPQQVPPPLQTTSPAPPADTHGARAVPLPERPEELVALAPPAAAQPPEPEPPVRLPNEPAPPAETRAATAEPPPGEAPPAPAALPAPPVPDPPRSAAVQLPEQPAAAEAPQQAGEARQDTAAQVEAPEAPEPAASPVAPETAQGGADVSSAQTAELPEPRFGQRQPEASRPQLALVLPAQPAQSDVAGQVTAPADPDPLPGPEPAQAQDLPEPAFARPVADPFKPLSDAKLAGVSALGIPQARSDPSPEDMPLPQADAPPVRYTGRDTSPSVGLGPAVFGPDDELILQIETAGGEMSDTIIAYGTRSGVYIPLGAFSRFLDLAISVGDAGRYASGWFIDESKTLTVDLNQRTLTVEGKEMPLPPSDAAAYEGELYLRAERYPDMFPLTLEIDLRNQSIKVKTLVPFPFEARIAREVARGRLGAKGGQNQEPVWPREETPYRAFSFPMADVELRGIADSTLGQRAEGDVRLAGDLAFMTAQTFVSGSSRDGLTGARVQLGRRDPDAELLGPLKATEFQIGDVNTMSLPLGLRGTGGRGAFITNAPLESASVFDKIDLRGELPDGYEVELYRNNILIDSTRTPVNGQYEFLQVPVDYGLNVFRFVFYGPQGQRREEVKRVSVGDGRLAKGQLVYSFGAVQKATNVFNVRGPLYSPVDDEGSWRGSALLQYGLTSGLTASLGGAWYESEGRKNWMATAGIRTGIAGIAARLDFGLQNGGGKAAQLSLGGTLFGATYTLEHAEYRGRFNDEVNTISLNPLRRSTELNLNSVLHLGGDTDSWMLPISARFQRLEYLNGLKTTEASLRASTRLGGFMLSNTFDYEQVRGANQFGFSQLRGAFDLASITGSRFEYRLGADYTVLPRVKLNTVKLDLDYALDKKTLLRGSVSHGFDPSQTQFGLSAVRKLGNFTLAFEGNYGVPRREYSAALRLGFSFGRNPLTGRFFFEQPGLSSSGAMAIRAFQDKNGDGRYDADDTLLPDVEFGNGSQRIQTGASGIGFLGNMGDSRPASVRINLDTLPDITLAPKTEGIEIVPRPGRVHASEFAVRALGEVEGTAYFGGGEANKGVSGLLLQLIGKDGEPAARAKTEADGFFLFERVAPGDYTIRIDPEQAERLKIRLSAASSVSVDMTGSVARTDITVVQE